MISSRQPSDLEIERNRYIRCNTMIDVALISCLIGFSLIIIVYFIVLVERGKSITIS